MSNTVGKNKILWEINFFEKYSTMSSVNLLVGAKLQDQTLLLVGYVSCE